MQPVGHLLIAILNGREMIDPRVADAIEAAQHGLMRMGWLSTRASFGSADLCDARNCHVSHFYANAHFTHILCLDDDVSWDAGAMERLVSHPVDFVIGAYPKRAEGEGYAVRTLPGPIECVDPETGTPHRRGLIKIAAGPGGMMRLSRKVIADLIAANADDWYHHPKVTGGRAWNLFKFVVENNVRVSEDMHFCDRWRALGGTVWCDPHIMLHHHGRKAYSGRFVDHLKELGRLVEPASLWPKKGSNMNNPVARLVERT